MGQDYAVCCCVGRVNCLYFTERLRSAERLPARASHQEEIVKVRKAVIPAAGLGTRFLPASKALPKEMLPIVDKPAIQYIVEEIVEAGIEDILIITGRGKRAIEDHFDKSLELNVALKEKEKHKMLATLEEIEKLADIHYLRQKEALGTGHAQLD